MGNRPWARQGHIGESSHEAAHPSSIGAGPLEAWGRWWRVRGILLRVRAQQWDLRRMRSAGLWAPGGPSLTGRLSLATPGVVHLTGKRPGLLGLHTLSGRPTHYDPP